MGLKTFSEEDLTCASEVKHFLRHQGRAFANSWVDATFLDLGVSTLA